MAMMPKGSVLREGIGRCGVATWGHGELRIRRSKQLQIVWTQLLPASVPSDTCLEVDEGQDGEMMQDGGVHLSRVSVYIKSI
jgi:hypothetical protein